MAPMARETDVRAIFDTRSLVGATVGAEPELTLVGGGSYRAARITRA